MRKFRRTTAEFVVDAKAVHGDRYDYSAGEYAGAHLATTIICPDHGQFRQSPSAHLSGAGCPKCATAAGSDRLRWTTAKFIEEARRCFSNKFDYDAVDYKGMWEPVQISCPEHGSFRRLPVSHLNGSHGCPRCAVAAVASRSRMTTLVFKQRAADVHGDRYDYRQAEVKDSKSKIKIGCRTHGFFLQSASVHLAGSGCPKCGAEETANRQRQPRDGFVARAHAVHGDKYDYGQVEYSTARTPVTIVCPVHGAFQQTPDMHLRSGCRQCADEALPGAYSEHRFRKGDGIGELDGVLYYARFGANDGETFYKVGISKNNAAKRFAGYAGGYGYKMELLATRTLPLRLAYELEQRVLQEHAHAAYRPVKTTKNGRRFGGRTECFSTPLPDKLVQLLFASTNGDV